MKEKDSKIKMRRFTNWNGDQEEDIITSARRLRREAMLEIVIISDPDNRINSEADLQRLLHSSLYSGEIRRDADVILDVNKSSCVKDDEKEQCSVCMSHFQENETKSELSCSHKFHYDCIIEWGKHKQECPLCRESISVKQN